MLDNNYILEFIHSLNCEVSLNEPMSHHTTFKIGGPVDFFVSVFDKKSLADLLSFCQKNDINTFIIGNGSNLLINDNGLKGICIKYICEDITIDPDDSTKIICSSGASLAKLCNFALEHSLSGLEFAWGIPGSVGGAVYMNAGAYSGQIKDIIISSEHCLRNGQKGIFNKNELNLSYRHSTYANNDYVITKAVFKLISGNKNDIKARMTNLMQRRISKQPLDLPSAGSVFKRPTGYFAGKLIEDCGLKGFRIGGASVSTKHSGFIVNDKNATFNDVKNLIDTVKNKVFEEKGVNLECEIKMI